MKTRFVLRDVDGAEINLNEVAFYAEIPADVDAVMFEATDEPGEYVAVVYLRSRPTKPTCAEPELNIDLCLVRDSDASWTDDHAICNLPRGHPGHWHSEYLTDGTLWTQWSSVLPIDELRRVERYETPEECREGRKP